MTSKCLIVMKYSSFLLNASGSIHEINNKNTILNFDIDLSFLLVLSGSTKKKAVTKNSHKVSHCVCDIRSGFLLKPI